MSTWTDEKHEDARHLTETGHLGRTTHTLVKESLGYLVQALDEIERLRALTTITDSMVDRAAREIYGPARWDTDIFLVRRPNSHWPRLTQGIRDARDKARAALEAALTPKENEA